MGKPSAANPVTLQLGTAVLLLFLGVCQCAMAGDGQPISLGELLRFHSAQSNINFVLDQSLTLDQQLDVGPRNWRNPAQLDDILSAAGLRQQLTEQGDRLIRKSRALELQLSQLQIEASGLSASSEQPDLGEQTASSTVIDSGLVARNGDNQLNDLFLRAANVFGARDDFQIRGVPRIGDLNTLGNANVFADGVPLPDSVLSILPVSTWDVDQVRFDRGSLSARQPGPFASYSGAINMEYFEPAFENTASLLLRYDHLQDSQLAAAYNRQLRQEELATRVTIDRLSKDGTLVSAADGHQQVDQSDSLTLRASLLWEPVEPGNMRASASVAVIDGDAGPQSFVIHQQSARDPFDREGFFPPIDQQSVSARQARLELDYEDEEQRLWHAVLAGSDSKHELDTSRSIANELLPTFDLVDRTDTTVSYATLGMSRGLGANGSFQIEANLGVVEEQQQVDRDRALWRVDTELERYSLSVAYQHEFGFGVRSHARVRHDRDRLRTHCVVSGDGAGSIDGSSLSCARLLGFYVSLPGDQALEPLKTDFDQWSPELAVSWQASDKLRFFGRGYRGYNTGGAASSVTLSGRPFYLVYQPEQSDNLELGADIDRDEARMNSRLTAFYTKLTNQWTPVLDGADFPLGQIDNSGRSRLYGLEWDGRVRMDRNHQLQFSLGYLHTSYVNFVPFERDADLENVAGNQFAGAPEFSGSIAVAGDYAAHWRWAIALSHHSAAFANANNSTAGSIPAATLVDFKASYRWKHSELSLFARNLFDEDYLETTPRVIRGSELVEYNLGRPRAIGLSYRYDF